MSVTQNLFKGKSLHFTDFIFPTIDAVGSTASRMSNGESFHSAAIKGVGTALINDTMMGMLSKPVQTALFAGTIAEMGLSVAISAGKKNTDMLSYATGGAGMYNKTQIHSKNAQTMRQRGMAMINDNGEVIRSAFGSEARAYYRSAF